ncbi:putative nucleoside-diphosphate-sugar epimerase [Methanosarcina mazei Go1]|uniref:Putative nucleoside-diphosphate-sugar epimerase n=1 Tax=Methanosarcina mazei (strain ATCC BAA-159 / DSM 3647 / Goe1 / Go1 / JCM 11833 / OCM 88) TaxID=192952 RepID=Q8Q0I6_METMA|nr:putative nucleoside-diphosphate-sugar epimerase [Methanosarcina mazei Go1]WIM43421.1 NmrA/HSCARG family protein [Methanosarcina mazei]
MILLIGATGNIGLPIVKSLQKKGAEVRLLVHNEKSSAKIQALGQMEIFIGDFRNDSDLRESMKGCSSVFHVVPPFTKDEAEIGYRVIENARHAGVEHIVFNSVLHPQLRKMEHHAQKLLVEEAVIESGLAFNIIQPAMLMQNLLMVWRTIRENGIYPVISSPDKKMSLIDSEDIGEAVANILTDPSLRNATFELAGSDLLTYKEMALIISEELNQPVKVVPVDDKGREELARKQGMSSYAIHAFLKMAKHYDEHGFSGSNPLVLTSILKRPPNSYRDFIRRLIAEDGGI